MAEELMFGIRSSYLKLGEWVSLIHIGRNGVPEKVNVREWSGVVGVNRDTRRNRLTHREHAMRARLTTSPFTTLRELIAPPMWGGDDGCLLPTDRGFLWQSVRVLLSQGKKWYTTQVSCSARASGFFQVCERLLVHPPMWGFWRLTCSSPRNNQKEDF